MIGTILIRQAGPYTVTYVPGKGLCCNGVATTYDFGRIAGTDFVATVDTKVDGANGKRDRVGLTDEHVKAITGAGWAREAAFQAEYEVEHREEIAHLNDLQRKAKAFDRVINEGAEGFNPYRAGSAPTYRRSR